MPDPSTRRGLVNLGIIAGLTLLVVGVLWTIGSTWNPKIDVIDGDTIGIGDERIRIIGLDAPETWPGHFECEGERVQGERAAATLRAILDSADRVKIDRQGPGKWPGRTLAYVYADGVDVATIMIEAGWARPNNGEGRQPWPQCR